MASECVGSDVIDYQGETPADAPKVLESFLPQEPPSVGAAGVLVPSNEQSFEQIHVRDDRWARGGNGSFRSARISTNFDLL